MSKHLTPSQSRNIICRYADGVSMPDLAVEYGITKMCVSKLLKRNGIKARDKHECQVRKPGILDMLSPYKQFDGYPSVAGILKDKLVVVIADPEQWYVHHIMSSHNVTHAIAVKATLSLKHMIESDGKQMLFLWKDELHRPGLINMCMHKTGGGKKVCYARQTSVVDVPLAVSNNFYDMHHLQGRVRQGTTYGLEFDGRLVACMTFASGGICRGDKNAALLARFAAVGSIPGAASKLLSKFKQDNPGVPIISYSDERYAPSGVLYTTLGFVPTKTYSPDYRYWRDGRWYPKNTKQKKHLIQECAQKRVQLSGSETEFDMAYLLGYYRCYDCGKISWRLDVTSKVAM